MSFHSWIFLVFTLFPGSCVGWYLKGMHCVAFSQKLEKKNINKNEYCKILS